MFMSFATLRRNPGIKRAVSIFRQEAKIAFCRGTPYEGLQRIGLSALESSAPTVGQAEKHQAH